MKLLLSKGAKAAVTCLDGRTPLHGAAERGGLEIVQALIHAGCDVNQANWCKTSPLHLAAEYGRLDVVEELVNDGATIDFVDSKGNTALHVAAKCNNRDIVQYLISMKANHLILNNDGLKAYEIAPEPLKTELTEFVIEKLMFRTRDADDEPLLTKGMCVFCQAEQPVIAFRPCPHIQLCDKCYINHKSMMLSCPICKKNLKRVAALNPPKEPEPIEEDPPEEEEKPEPPKTEEEEKNEEEEEKNEEEEKKELGEDDTEATKGATDDFSEY